MLQKAGGRVSLLHFIEMTIFDSILPVVNLRHWILLFFFLFSCDAKEKAKPIVYNGPLKQAENIFMHYTEKEKVKTILQAKKVNEFQNGDREFPEGIYMEFYDETGKMTSTLRANTAYYFKQENKWRGRGKVEVVNIEKGQQLNSEELFWLPATKKIFTEKFVTITDQKDVIYGTGLLADQDLSHYTIKNPNGLVEVKD
jgi:LPS export ABC transporter protein LptC